jgi:hypothetical protein
LRKLETVLATLIAAYSTGAAAQESAAAAQENPLGAQEGAAPVSEEIQLTLPAKKLFLDAFLETSLSKDMAFKPVSLAPDLWYGVSDDVTLGLVHSGRGTTGIFGSAGNGLCFTGKSNGCPKAYNNLGIDGRYQIVRRAGISLAADGGLYARSLDPFQLSLKLGVLARFHKDAFSFELDPSLFLGMTKRAAGLGNKEILAAPATFMYALTPKLGLAGQLALWMPLSDTSLTMFGFSLGVQYFITDQLILDAAFSLPAVLGGSAVPDGVDLRTLTLGVAYAF